jgi:hypothetical protein
MRRLQWPVALAVWIVSAAALAADTGWQEAVARLAYERTRAETCVKALKTYGDQAAIKRGEIQIYLFDRDKGTLVQRIEVPSAVDRLVFSPDGSRLAAVNLWDWGFHLP